MPTPSRSPTTRTADAATGSPSNASSVTSGPVSGAALLERAAERRVRLARDPQRRFAHQRRARCDRLQAAPVRAVALARRAVDVDDHVPHLGARAGPPAVQPPAQHEPAADAGPDREQRDVGAAARRAGASLRPDRAVGVVVDLDRQPEPLGHHLAELQIGEREVDRLHRDAGPAVERAGDPEADGLYLPVNRLASLLNRVDRRVEQRSLVDPEDLAARSVVNGEPLRIDRSRQELGPAQIDADHAAGRHFDHPTPFAMADEKPTYTKYRSRPKLFGGKGSSNGAREGLDDLRGGVPRPEDPNKRRLRDRFTFWRVLGYIAARRRRLAAALAAAVPRSPPRSSARGRPTRPAARSATPATR